jgi:hypothetical protein
MWTKLKLFYAIDLSSFMVIEVQCYEFHVINCITPFSLRENYISITCRISHFFMVWGLTLFLFLGHMFRLISSCQKEVGSAHAAHILVAILAIHT